MPTKQFAIDRNINNVSHQDFGDGLGDFTGSNSNDNHLPLGNYTDAPAGFVYIFDPTYLRFVLDFSDVISITSAKLWLKKTGGTHVPMLSCSLRVRRVTSSWTEDGGSEGTWSGAYQATESTTTSGQKTVSVSSAESVWISVDITTIVNAWKAGSTNHGVELYVEPNTGDSTEFYAMDASSANEPYIELTYVSNTAPNAPGGVILPAPGSVETTATPTFQFTHSDPDGDPLVSYDIQVDNNSAFSSPLWDGVNQTSGIVGNDVTRVYGGSALSRGTTYYWRARTNDGTVDGAWLATRSFIYNGLPTVTKDAPTAGALAAIHNLGELALWTSGGAHAKPTMKFTPSDGESSLTKYRLRIYDAAVAGTMLYDSGEVVQAMSSGVQVAVNVDYALVNGTEYWWTIDVYDGQEWAGESSRTAFKVRWAQGLFEHDSGSAASTNWGMATGTITEQVALIFRSATSSGGSGATGLTPFVSSIASVTVQQWLQVCVRLSTDSAGTDGSLADMTFSYYGTPSTPDGWSVS